MVDTKFRVSLDVSHLLNLLLRSIGPCRGTASLAVSSKIRTPGDQTLRVSTQDIVESPSLLQCANKEFSLTYRRHIEMFLDSQQRFSSLLTSHNRASQYDARNGAFGAYLQRAQAVAANDSECVYTAANNNAFPFG